MHKSICQQKQLKQGEKGRDHSPSFASQESSSHEEFSSKQGKEDCFPFSKVCGLFASVHAKCVKRKKKKKITLKPGVQKNIR